MIAYCNYGHITERTNWGKQGHTDIYLITLSLPHATPTITHAWVGEISQFGLLTEKGEDQGRTKRQGHTESSKPPIPARHPCQLKVCIRGHR